MKCNFIYLDEVCKTHMLAANIKWSTIVIIAATFHQNSNVKALYVNCLRVAYLTKMMTQLCFMIRHDKNTV